MRTSLAGFFANNVKVRSADREMVRSALRKALAKEPAVAARDALTRALKQVEGE